MSSCFGIRREDKNRWERRVPLVPDDIQELKRRFFFDIWLQPSAIRIFSDKEFNRAGAVIREDITACPVVFAVKEIPLNFLESGKTYVFFSHTTKGQAHNMPMLRKILELRCQLIDYERVTDGSGRRLLFFGKYAGLAGMIDILWALGSRLSWEGIPNPFSQVRQAHRYADLSEAKEAIKDVGMRIQSEGLPEPLTPLIFGFAGYGNASQGAQEILDLLPTQKVQPDTLFDIAGNPRNAIYKVVFKEQELVEPISPKDSFELQDYYKHPERYRSCFHEYLPYLSVLVNAIYWDERYPRLVSKEHLRLLFDGPWPPRLRVIGDISCDVEGAIEATVRTTDPDNPIYVYNPLKDTALDGCEGVGPVIVAVDNLPCELPKEASIHFSQALKPFVPEIVSADYSVDFHRCELSPAIKSAVIAYHGELTSNYRYIGKSL